jgi:hypothetical protein
MKVHVLGVIEYNSAATSMWESITECRVRLKTIKRLFVAGCTLLVTDLGQVGKTTLMLGMATLALQILTKIRLVVRRVMCALKSMAANAAFSQLFMI